ncbi:MAG TPA: phosphotransferase [Phycisphaerae bacterium]|nr:phosphotransferase [Phycisphaerae bacterium]
MKDDERNPSAELWVKPLRDPLHPAVSRQMRQMNQFRRTMDNWVFRSVHYHEIGEKQLVMEAIQGRALRELLARAGGPFATVQARDFARQLAGLAGAWLGHFHKWKPARKPKTYDTGSVVELALDKIGLLSKAGLPEGLANRIRSALEEGSRETPDNLVVMLHGDFKPSNLMVTDNQMVGVDMEGHGWGHPLIDLGSFIAACTTLRSSALLGSHCPQWWRLVCSEFLLGYESVNEWSRAGLGMQVLKNVLALFEYMRCRHTYLLWWLRGRPLMVRTLAELLDAPLLETQGT